GPQGNHRPEDQQPLRGRSPFFDTPDLVESALYHRQHRNGGNQQEHGAHGRQSRGLAGKGIQVIQDGGGDRAGYQALQHIDFQRSTEVGKQRESRKNRQRDGKQGDQGEHSGESQAASHLGQTLFVQSLGRKTKQLAKLPHAQPG